MVQLWFSCGSVVCGMIFMVSASVKLVGWFEVCWFSFGSTLVQILVAWCFLVQHWFIFGSIVPGQVCSGSAWAQLWLSFVPACCGVILYGSALVHHLVSWLWPDLMWFSFGSVVCWSGCIWFSCDPVLVQLSCIFLWCGVWLQFRCDAAGCGSRFYGSGELWFSVGGAGLVQLLGQS